jgi:hypothetical protein
MVFTKVKTAFALVLVVGIIGLGAGGLVSPTLATGPTEETKELQEQGQANSDDVHARLVELDQQLQQLQNQIARLRQDTQARRKRTSEPDAPLIRLFKYRVPFETGVTESKEGGRIEIREVWGTRPRIQLGGQYLVRGKYVLPPGERGKLYFYATAGGAWGAVGTTLDLQTTEVDKPEGEFTLVHGMAGQGYFHLYLAEREHYSRWFANVYFGNGDNVLRK